MNELGIRYRCHTETEKPSIVLAHEPGLETRLAVENPDDWDFDPSLNEDRRSFKQWLEDAQREHQGMVSFLRSEGIEVMIVGNLLRTKQDEIVAYLDREFRGIQRKIAKFDSNIQWTIQQSYEEVMQSPISGLLLGLESSKSFRKLPYGTKLQVYRELKTLMPQTSLYFTQDPVIPSPAGLIKSRMSMWIRRQEPDIIEIALGNENYVYRLRNGTDGGDATMCSYAHGGDVAYIGGRMLFGVNALSGRCIQAESETLAQRAKVSDLVRFYAPDFFDTRKCYAAGNVMHTDTIMMPVSEPELLANVKMLRETGVKEGTDALVSAYQWARKNFDRIIEVPDDEQPKWGANVFPLGDRRILSARHLPKTNRNLAEAGFSVFDLEARTLTSGYGSWHCMIAYLK